MSSSILCFHQNSFKNFQFGLCYFDSSSIVPPPHSEFLKSDLLPILSIIHNQLSIQSSCFTPSFHIYSKKVIHKKMFFSVIKYLFLLKYRTLKLIDGFWRDPPKIWMLFLSFPFENISDTSFDTRLGICVLKQIKREKNRSEYELVSQMFKLHFLWMEILLFVNLIMTKQNIFVSN